MNNKQLAIVATGVAAVLAVIIVLLVTGGAPTEQSAEDTAGDVTLSEGPGPPREQSLADIRAARVYLDAGQIVFEAEMAVPIPETLRKEAMSWRWQVLEGGSETWIVSANISVDQPVGSVLSTQTDYGASTNDETLPGRVDLAGKKISVRLDAAEIKDFPVGFTWRLETSLDGDRGDARSAVATDAAPESGLGEYPPP